MAELSTPGESREARLKRMQMRSMRRGTKEMDLILMRFVAAHLADMDGVQLDAYDALLSENDQDLYQWISGQAPAPSTHAPLIDRIRAEIDAA